MSQRPDRRSGIIAWLTSRPGSVRLELGIAATLIVILTSAQLIIADGPSLVVAALTSIVFPAFLILCRFGIGYLVTAGSGTSTD